MQPGAHVGAAAEVFGWAQPATEEPSHAEAPEQPYDRVRESEELEAACVPRGWQGEPSEGGLGVERRERHVEAEGVGAWLAPRVPRQVATQVDQQKGEHREVPSAAEEGVHAARRPPPPYPHLAPFQRRVRA